MAQFAFFYDQSRCNGCKTCEMACKDYHDLPAERTFVRVFEYEATEGDWKDAGNGTYTAPTLASYFHELACNHCDDPACVKACPTGACAKDPETGVVSIDPNVCNGSGMCHEACPYMQPTPNEETKKCEKCDGCKDRVAEGLLPVCVEACPQRALTCGDASEVPEGYERASLAPLPSPDQTKPNFYVKASKSAKKAEGKKGELANEPEVE